MTFDIQASENTQQTGRSSAGVSGDFRGGSLTRRDALAWLPWAVGGVVVLVLAVLWFRKGGR